ncbi:MAG: hypothetical protein L0Y66_10280 [Myxococcaceae bacterium]|nr:hypothetical protein [Myxococcaceae bacterium]
MRFAHHAAVLAVLLSTPVLASEGDPIRARRNVALLGELGWNGLSGLGVNVGFHVHPHFTLEVGGGLSGVGFKSGLRARVNFLKTNWTPFAAAGFLYGSGAGEDVLELTTDGNTILYRVRPSPFLQAVLGAEFTGDSGFTFTTSAGWAQLLQENFELVAGAPTPLQREASNIAFGSGVVLSVAFGYTF